MQSPAITNVADRLFADADDSVTAEAIRADFGSRMKDGFIQVTTVREMIASIKE
ncbi:hypothetical protein [Agrobacterium tumefaciens]|uniref:hypothetical protein n=1 Tax=Agrobacterium tumefaciens TaxID=358 RepID=UPI0015C32FB2